MKTMLMQFVSAWRQRYATGDTGVVTECVENVGSSIHRRVRHMARKGRFVGELGEFTERTLRLLDLTTDLPRDQRVRETSRLACVAMVGGLVGGEWDTQARRADATITCA